MTDGAGGWKITGGPCVLLAGTIYEGKAPDWCPSMADAMPNSMLLPPGYREKVEAEIERVRSEKTIT
jgi:hypothetical protein